MHTKHLVGGISNGRAFPTYSLLLRTRYRWIFLPLVVLLLRASKDSGLCNDNPDSINVPSLVQAQWVAGLLPSLVRRLRLFLSDSC
jgi:hypothetical protein